MRSSGDFEESDRIAARNFVAAANRVGVRRIVYLGGLGDPSESLSTHLRSRQETGEILRSGRAQVVEFRASIIIGSGSLSFEIGGPDRVSYRAIMRAYARQRELRRWMVPVPLLTPRLWNHGDCDSSLR